MTICHLLLQNQFSKHIQIHAADSVIEDDNKYKAPTHKGVDWEVMLHLFQEDIYVLMKVDNTLRLVSNTVLFSQQNNMYLIDELLKHWSSAIKLLIQGNSWFSNT